MEFSLEKSLEILERTPGVFKLLLSGLDDDWTTCNEGGETWSAFDIMGHLIHGEKTDWIQRLEIILGNSSDKTFTPFDRFAQFEESKGKTLNTLLDEFAELRLKNLEKLKEKNITEEDLMKKGIHPALGEVTLHELLSTWTVHDLTHLNQVTRVMSKHYLEDVGPWREYFRLLKNE